MKDRQYYECTNCTNRALSKSSEDIGSECACGKPDWKLMRNQQSYIVGEEDYFESKGEI